MGRRSPNLHFSQFLPESWIRFVPCHPLGRFPLSRIPALRPWSSYHAATGGVWERGPRLLRGLCRPKGNRTTFSSPLPDPRRQASSEDAKASGAWRVGLGRRGSITSPRPIPGSLQSQNLGFYFPLRRTQPLPTPPPRPFWRESRRVWVSAEFPVLQARPLCTW